MSPKGTTRDNSPQLLFAAWQVVTVFTIVLAVQLWSIRRLLAPSIAVKSSDRPFIVFCSSELEHLTAGGAGVVVADSARALYRAGWHVLIILDVIGETQGVLDKWAARAQKVWGRRQQHHAEQDRPARATTRPTGKINLLQLSDLAEEIDDNVSGHQSLSSQLWDKSRQWSRAVARFQGVADAIEFFDCGGPAYHTLLKRSKGAYQFPLETQIWIRTHGMHQAIADGEGGGARKDGARSVHLPKLHAQLETVYAMETRALQMADAVIANSLGIAREYASTYDLDASRRVTVISPTLGTLQDIIDFDQDRPHHYVRSPESEFINILVYGKLQRVKGPDLAAKALVMAMRELASKWDGEVIFAGDDMPCDNDPSLKMSTCLASLIPSNLSSRFRFTGRIKRGSLGKFARRERVGFAILPSRYETFCLAAHEASFFGLYLVLPRLPAYEGFFVDGENAAMFDGESPDDLARVIQQELLHLTSKRGSAVVAARPPIFYSNPSESYATLMFQWTVRSTGN